MFGADGEISEKVVQQFLLLNLKFFASGQKLSLVNTSW